jgi:hypothetical protein
MTHYLSAELDRYLRESISAWGSASWFYRDSATYTAPINVAFNDLPLQNPTMLGITRLDTDLAKDILDSLMEPQQGNWAAWGGTEQFSTSVIQQAIQKSRDEFLLETGMILKATDNFALPPPPIGRVPLPDDVIDIRRVAWKDTSIPPQYRPLTLSDWWSLNAYSPGWTQNPAPAPNSYSMFVEPLLVLHLAPVVSNSGTLHLITLNAGAALDLTVGVKLGVPEMFTWVLKYGALRDLLGPNSIAYDPLRQRYAKARWDEGLSLAKLHSPLLTADVNGVQLNISSLADFDSYNANWQNVGGIPNRIAVVGWNMIALYPVPNTAEVSITLSIVKNPPLPQIDTDFLQVAREHLDVILDYARHLALFKAGGEELMNSKMGYDRMIEMAALQNSRLREKATSFYALTGRVEGEMARQPFTEKGFQKPSLTTAQSQQQGSQQQGG